MLLDDLVSFCDKNLLPSATNVAVAPVITRRDPAVTVVITACIKFIFRKEPELTQKHCMTVLRCFIIMCASIHTYTQLSCTAPSKKSTII